MHIYLDKLIRALRRDSGKPLSVIARDVAANARAIASAAAYLRRCDAVGARARCFGRPDIDNHGSIVIGDDFAASCTFGTLVMATSPRGRIRIGDGVTINYGSAITSASHVSLGNHVMVGPYCVVADTDAPLVDDVAPVPIEVGDDVWLAGRVTVRPGARIGAGAVIGAGSVVEGDIPAMAIASGAPARVLRIRRPSELPPPAAVRSIEHAHARVSEVRRRDASR